MSMTLFSIYTSAHHGRRPESTRCQEGRAYIQFMTGVERNVLQCLVEHRSLTSPCLCCSICYNKFLLDAVWARAWRLYCFARSLYHIARAPAQKSQAHIPDTCNCCSTFVPPPRGTVRKRPSCARPALRQTWGCKASLLWRQRRAHGCISLAQMTLQKVSSSCARPALQQTGSCKAGLL